VKPRPVTAAVNHVLHSTPLAMERLARHAGRTASFKVGPARFAFTIQPAGDLLAAAAGTPPDLEVRLSPALLPRLAAGEEAAFREVDMQGDADLAATVVFLARHLRWDAEEDLSRVVGDIAAHRIAGAARGFTRWGRDAAFRAAAGAAEYWTEESPLLASRVKVEDFVRGVDALRDDVERLEKRLAALSARSRD
jgi:ubiquinone biosynthesis protein UbiJ